MLYFSMILHAFESLKDVDELYGSRWTHEIVGFSSADSVAAIMIVLVFAFNGVILAITIYQITDEALYKSRARRLIMMVDNMEAQAPVGSMESFARLEERIRSGRLYRRDAHGRVVESALPTSGPFHVFLSHSAQYHRIRPCEWCSKF